MAAAVEDEGGRKKAEKVSDKFDITQEHLYVGRAWDAGRGITKPYPSITNSDVIIHAQYYNLVPSSIESIRVEAPKTFWAFGRLAGTGGRAASIWPIMNAPFCPRRIARFTADSV